MLWCRHLKCPQQRPLNSIIFLKIWLHCGNHVKELCSFVLYMNQDVFSWPCGVDRSMLHHPFCFSFFCGSNPLIGCFKSISVNMAEIMQPNLASEMILFVKPVWYSSHSQPNHLVAVFALSRVNITLSDLVVLSTCYIIKMSDDNKSHRPRAMKSYWSTNTYAYPHHHMHTYQSTHTQKAPADAVWTTQLLL